MTIFRSSSMTLAKMSTLYLPTGFSRSISSMSRPIAFYSSETASLLSWSAIHGVGWNWDWCSQTTVSQSSYLSRSDPPCGGRCVGKATQCRETSNRLAVYYRRCSDQATPTLSSSCRRSVTNSELKLHSLRPRVCLTPTRIRQLRYLSTGYRRTRHSPVGCWSRSHGLRPRCATWWGFTPRVSRR